MTAPSRLKRSLFFLVGDVLLISLGLFLAYLIRFEGLIPSMFMADLSKYMAVILTVKIPIFYLFGLYRMTWRYVSFKELVDVFQAVTMSSLLLGALLYLVEVDSWLGIVPRSIPILDYILTLFLIGGFRASKRVFNSMAGGFAAGGKRSLIAGAGDAGEQILRAMLKEVRAEYSPIGFIDDDPAKQGTAIHGVPVVGNCDDILGIAKRHQPDELIIAIPSAPPEVIKKIVRLGRAAHIKEIKILPGFREIVSGQVGLGDIRDVQLEDLLGRDPVEVDMDEVGSYISDRVVLVTGAAGSIGFELCRQIHRFNPALLIALDQDESGIFHVENELASMGEHVQCIPVICDIRDKQKLEMIFEKHKPHVVFHAAAYKHVPLMEAHPDESVKNNIFGTLTVAKVAKNNEAERFVLISTDKAVNPTSVMGATKRVAEMLIHELNKEGPTRFMAVRFGNVLGSRGSVIPEFQRQIKNGGPVTVTHKDIERYFMVTSEAVLLVMQAGAMGTGGEVFVLDMGSPVKILDLARELIRLSGYEPDVDIPIAFTGLRPGEKLFEELLTDEEGTDSTQHKQIFVAKMQEVIEPKMLESKLDRLSELSKSRESDEIINALREIVPSYHQPSAEKQPN